MIMIVSTLYFQNCWRLPGPNNTPAAYAQTVNPSEYFVSREKGTISKPLPYFFLTSHTFFLARLAMIKLNASVLL
jgi:hypothetical protein